MLEKNICFSLHIDRTGSLSAPTTSTLPTTINPEKSPWWDPYLVHPGAGKFVAKFTIARLVRVMFHFFSYSSYDWPAQTGGFLHVV